MVLGRDDCLLRRPGSLLLFQVVYRQRLPEAENMGHTAASQTWSHLQGSLDLWRRVICPCTGAYRQTESLSDVQLRSGRGAPCNAALKRVEAFRIYS